MTGDFWLVAVVGGVGYLLVISGVAAIWFKVKVDEKKKLFWECFGAIIAVAVASGCSGWQLRLQKGKRCKCLPRGGEPVGKLVAEIMA